MAAIPPVCDFDWLAPDFNLMGVDQKKYNLDSVKGKNGTLIMFICNHCPYVLAVLDRIIRDSKDLIDHGIGVAAISSNDVDTYPEDSFENMMRSVHLIFLDLTLVWVYNTEEDWMHQEKKLDLKILEGIFLKQCL